MTTTGHIDLPVPRATPIHPTMLAATTIRVLRQLRADPRTIAMVLLIPVLLMVLLYFMFSTSPTLPNGRNSFDIYAVPMLGILPFVTMFLVTSISMLRERTSGTLERLLATPISRLDLLGGYGIAFSVTAAAQAVIACAVTFGLLGLTISGSIGYVILIAIVDAMLGVGLGLLCSAFARTEFQAVQFLPAVVIPQLFLCGLFVPRDSLPRWMELLSNIMPLSYAVDALKQVATYPEATGQMWRDIAVVLAWTVAALALGAATLRRRTA